MTDPIDITKARAFLKADGDDDDLITDQIADATTICEDYCNRKFYEVSADRDNDFMQALTDRTAALAARKTALAAVTGCTTDDDETRGLIEGHFTQTLSEISKRINGIVIDDAINAAILITIGHLYVNREDNVSTGNNVVQVPVGAQRILQPKLWIGNLVSGGVDKRHCWWDELPCEGS